ncbi:MAG: hypothetical protein IKV81_07255 [Clostridia bacterium]|nr:hypothetical protein [Clostridia bacterium]
MLILVSAFSGCGAKKATELKYDSNPEIKTLSSQTIAENDKLKLDYNEEFRSISITNKISGKVWSNVVVDENGETESTSTMSISVQNMQIYQYASYYSGLNDNVKVSVEKIENGIKYTYYFDDLKISIPVSYTLASDSMKISIDPTKIAEGDKNYRLVYAAPSPRLCSVHQDSKEGYLFVPFGGGALVDVADSANAPRKFNTGPSNFASLSTEYSGNSPDTAVMPVYGAKDGSDAIFCVGEQSPSTLGLEIAAGEKTTNYAIVNPRIYFVDYDYTKGKAASSGDVRQLSKRTDKEITIGCYFLENEKANYMGMADCFRNYLEKNGYLEKSEFNKAPYSVTVLGGVMSTESILGVPNKTLKTLTTISRAQEIISELSQSTKYNPVVRLEGFGETGINYGKIAGGFTISSKLGSKKDIKSLEKYAADNNIALFMNFEMSKFSKSGNGFAYKKDSAKTAILHSADKSGVNVPLRDANPDSAYRLLARDKQGEAVKKLINAVNKFDISGVNLASLGTLAYSDYDEKNTYPLSYKAESEPKEYISQLRENGNKVSGTASAYFAAGLVDTVFDVYLDGDGNYVTDKNIPFYQIVFSGVTPMYSKALNTEAYPQKTLAAAAASGVGISFTVLDNFHISYMETKAAKLYACDYESNKDMINTYVKNYADIYNAICGSRIVDYQIKENGVTVTTFENGSVVYANQTSRDAASDVGTLKGYEFKLGGVK